MRRPAHDRGAMKRLSPVLVALVLAGCGTDVTGPSASLFSCVFGEPRTTSTGEVVQVQGAENQGVCLAGDATSEYVYVPFYAAGDSGADLTFRMTGAGLGNAAVASARTTLEPGAFLGSVQEAPRFVRDYTVHDEVRRREARELGRLIRPGAPETSLRRSIIAADVPAVGELRDFNVAISCEDTDLRTGRVLYVSDQAVVYADTMNPAQLSSQDYAYFGETFDTLVYPVETGHFGVPADIDDNGRAILFFTRAVNERNPAGSQSVTIGFFWSGDLFPETSTPRLEACPASNHGEMFYLIAPDPDGEVGSPFTLQDVRELAIPLIGHEYQHLINASRRLFENEATTFERPWLNEALSHAAEELLFFATSGLEPGANIDIQALRDAPGSADSLFNEYMGSNFNNFSKYLSRPDTASLLGPADQLATRGAAWAFLRYAADRSGDPDFLYDVVNGTTAGLDNLNQAIGSASALDWMRDWGVSLYADDFVDGVDSRFTTTSWNWRSLFENSNLEEYPLRVESLASGETATATLLNGGLTINRFGVADAGRATVHVEADGGAPPPALRGSFLRVR